MRSTHNKQIKFITLTPFACFQYTRCLLASPGSKYGKSSFALSRAKATPSWPSPGTLETFAGTRTRTQSSSRSSPKNASKTSHSIHSPPFPKITPEGLAVPKDPLRHLGRQHSQRHIRYCHVSHLLCLPSVYSSPPRQHRQQVWQKQKSPAS